MNGAILFSLVVAASNLHTQTTLMSTHDEVVSEVGNSVSEEARPDSSSPQTHRSTTWMWLSQLACSLPICRLLEGARTTTVYLWPTKESSSTSATMMTLPKLHFTKAFE